MPSPHHTETPLAPPDTQYPLWVSAAPGWLRPYLLLARLDRPIGTWLLLLPCWWGAALGALVAGRPWPDPVHLALFAAGALVMRSAGCAFNDAVDKDLDAQVARTRVRPVASGQISRTQAVAFASGLSLLGLVILVQFNAYTVWLGAASVLVVAAYPFMKRITHWPQAWLGLAFNWGALVGYSASVGQLETPALFLFASGVFWTLGYDTIYACQDVEDDAAIGVKSTARLFGPAVPRWVGAFFALQLGFLVAALSAAGIGWSGLAGVILPVAALLFWQVYQLSGRVPYHLRLFRAHRLIGLLIFAFICIFFVR